jgi:hypothetical protein
MNELKKVKPLWFDLYFLQNFFREELIYFIVVVIKRYDKNMMRLRKETARSTVTAVLLMWIG